MKTLGLFLDTTNPALQTVAENTSTPTDNMNKSLKLIDLLEFDLENLKNCHNQSSSRETTHTHTQGGLLNIFHKSPKLNSSNEDFSDSTHSPYSPRAYDAFFERMLDSTAELRRLQQEIYSMHYDSSNRKSSNNPPAPSRYAPSRTSSINDFEFYDAHDTFGEAYECDDGDDDDDGNDNDNDIDNDNDNVDVQDDDDEVDKEGTYHKEEVSGEVTSKYGPMQLSRRQQLPAPISGDVSCLKFEDMTPTHNRTIITGNWSAWCFEEKRWQRPHHHLLPSEL